MKQFRKYTTLKNNLYIVFSDKKYTDTLHTIPLLCAITKEI